MATTPKITPPFSWLGPFTTIIVLAGTLALGILFRFWQFVSLPPGLGGQTASSALDSLRLIEQGSIPGFSAANNFAPAWVVLQALPLRLFGATPEALRWWPALLGVLAVFTTWLWLRSWFNRRIAWIGALVIAIAPWTVTLSRNGSEAGAFPLLVSLTLWLATIAWRQGRLPVLIALIAVLALDLLMGPLGWWLVASMLVMGGAQLVHERKRPLLSRPRVVSLALGLATLVGIAVVTAQSRPQLVKLPAMAHFITDPGAFFHNCAATFLMLFAPGAGDTNYQHNLTGQPLLNVFFGLMFITGLLVSISRIQHRRYRWVLGLFGLLLLPAIVTTVGIPNAGRAIAVAPIVAGMVAIGTSYMLELWYATFPINSAARSAGQAAIIVLLSLTMYLSYTQYFRAWANMTEVYTAYNHGTVRLATNLKADKFNGQHFVVAPADQRDILAFVNHGGPAYRAIDPGDITALPTEAGSRQFLMVPGTRDAAMKLIKTKYPGGVLRPHYSAFNQTEIYYSYEVTK